MASRLWGVLRQPVEMRPSSAVHRKPGGTPQSVGFPGRVSEAARTARFGMGRTVRVGLADGHGAASVGSSGRIEGRAPAWNTSGHATQPLRGRGGSPRPQTQGSRVRQPWAMRRNRVAVGKSFRADKLRPRETAMSNHRKIRMRLPSILLVTPACPAPDKIMSKRFKKPVQITLEVQVISRRCPGSDEECHRSQLTTFMPSCC